MMHAVATTQSQPLNHFALISGDQNTTREYGEGVIEMEVSN